MNKQTWPLTFYVALAVSELSPEVAIELLGEPEVDFTAGDYELGAVSCGESHASVADGIAGSGVDHP